MGQKICELKYPHFSFNHRRERSILQNTVCAKSPVRCICYSIIASPLGITAPCSFFLCVGPCLRMLRTKFHHPQTKTFCLRGDIVDRTTERKSLDSTVWSDFRSVVRSTVPPLTEKVFVWGWWNLVHSILRQGPTQKKNYRALWHPGVFLLKHIHRTGLLAHTVSDGNAQFHGR